MSVSRTNFCLTMEDVLHLDYSYLKFSGRTAHYDELLIKAATENDTSCAKCCLKKGARINRIIRGVTALGVASAQGSTNVLKLMLENKQKRADDNYNENANKRAKLSLNLNETSNSRKEQKNIGYFVVCRDLEQEISTDLEDGPTPEGMDALEWDMEINDDANLSENHNEGSIYKWYADILNRTSEILESPEWDLDRFDNTGRNALHYAIINRQINSVNILLEHSANVNQCTGKGYSPLYLACETGNTEIINKLISLGANINFVSASKQTALHVAAKCGSIEIVKLLVEHGASVNALSYHENSPLIEAIAANKPEIVEYFIQKGSRVNVEDWIGRTPLRVAVQLTLYPIVKLLLHSGAKLVQSHCLLHEAVAQKHLEMVKLLVNHGSVLNLRDSKGNTPLIIACQLGAVEIVRYLLESGANPNLENIISGDACLHQAVEHVNDSKVFDSLLELLIEFNADLNMPSLQGTPLLLAIVYENPNIAALLIKHGANVNLSDQRSFIDNLTLALTRCFSFHIIKMLIYSGYDFKNTFVNLMTMKESKQGQDQVLNWIWFMKTNPMRLSDLCRIKIRNRFGQNVVKKVEQLPLPASLIRFLKLEIL